MAHPDPEQAQAALLSGAGDVIPLLEAILEHVPPPAALRNDQETAGGPLQFMVTMLDYDDYVGRIGIGRVQSGALRQGQTVLVGRPDVAGPTSQNRTALHL